MQILNDVALFDYTVVSQTEWFFGAADEVGSSDMNACANAVLEDLGVDPKTASNEEFWIVKNAIRNALCNLEEARGIY